MSKRKNFKFIFFSFYTEAARQASLIFLFFPLSGECNSQPLDEPPEL